MNRWKTGRLASSPLDPNTGERGVVWRDTVSADVFETASVDASEALRNWRSSRDGTRKGATVGFPDVKKRNRTIPTFRIRSRSKPGQTPPIRVTGPKTLRLCKIGEMRVHGATFRVRTMVAKGRFHIHSASFSFEKGRWW